MEISGGDVAHQGNHHSLAVVFSVQQIGAGRLRGAPKPAPDVYFERKKIQRRLAKVPVLRRQECRRQRRLAASGKPVDLDLPTYAGLGELVRTRPPEIGPALFDASHGVAQIVVRGQRGANQVLELLVL